MSHTLYFLAATWLAGQAGDARPMPQVSTGVVVESAPLYGDGQGQMNAGQPQQRRGFFSRIGSWFGGLFGRSNSTGPTYTGNGQMIGGPQMVPTQQIMPGQPMTRPLNTNEPPLAGPGKVSLAPSGAGSVVVSARMPVEQASAEGTRAEFDLPVADKFKDRLGHEADYSWITGQLYRLGNLWVLHYTCTGERDQHGGTMLLTTAGNMQNYREGDLVSVHGEVINGGRHSEQIPCPVYRVSEVNLVERAD